MSDHTIVKMIEDAISTGQDYGFAGNKEFSAVVLCQIQTAYDSGKLTEADYSRLCAEVKNVF